MRNRIIIVRGAGDIATGTIYELHQAGYRVLALECERPTAIRRAVCFSEAVYDETAEVEGVCARKIERAEQAFAVWEQQEIPVLVDSSGESIDALRPMAVVDLILAKKNLGTRREMAALVIGAGPGFTAGEDVDVVIETMRGYTHGKAIYEGTALPDTGIPGMVGGFDKERVIHSPAQGKIRNVRQIGERVEKGEVIAYVGKEPVYATLCGILRGLIREGFTVKKGMKIADIEPRANMREACYKRSDKAIAIGKGIREVLDRQIRLQYLLQIDVQKDKVIAVVGGGGKTTLIYRLAEELALCGKKVFITTTTHMNKPQTEEKDTADRESAEAAHAIVRYSINVEELMRRHAMSGSVEVIGRVCAEEPEKITALPEADYEALREQCDVLLVEADGAKRKPLKAPADHEPVIPKDADVVIGIAGASAVGQTVRTCCHREEEVSRLLGVSQEHVITETDIVQILHSSAGQRKGVTAQYRMVVGQADVLSEEQKERFRKTPEIILWSGRE